MASGDVAFAATSLGVMTTNPEGGSGNVLSFGVEDYSPNPTADDGGFTTWLNAGNENYSFRVTVQVVFDQTGTYTSIGHPPFLATKTYDVSITEH